MKSRLTDLQNRTINTSYHNGHLKSPRFILLLLIFLTICSGAFSQTSVDKCYKSNFTQDSIKYRVWIPGGWSPLKRYPSIYINEYGALDNNGMLFAANINNFMNEFPQTVVIEIRSGDMKHMNFSYETGKIGEEGQMFVKSLKEELIPSVEKEFKTSKFRGFVGQSYSATYANYLFLHEPGLFNAYIILTPEQVGKAQPGFSITPEIKSYYNSHSTLYYIAPAGRDLERRKNYALEIQRCLAILDTTNFHFKNELHPEADHNSILSFAALPALKYLYSFYTSDASYSGDLKTTLIKRQQITKQIYDLDFPKTSWSQSHFLNLAANRKDKEGMDFIADFFRGESTVDNALMLFNTAYVYYDTFKDYSKAEKYFRLSIENAKKFNSHVYILNGYSWLSHMYDKGMSNTDKSLDLLREAYNYTNSPIYKYKIGVICFESGTHLNEGINALKFYLKNPETRSPEKEMVSSEAANLLLSKCFYKQHKVQLAQYYLAESLSLNQNFEAALKWQATLNSK